MRIATWNVNGIRARLDFVLRWLDERQPDVLGIQELKSTNDQLPEDALREAGYHVLAHGQKAWNGVAILSRDEPQWHHLGLPGGEDLGSRLAAARMGDFNFVTVYCPNGKSVDHPDFEAKLNWYDHLLAFIDDHFTPSDQLVLCGDFNVVPAAVDSWNEDILEGTIFHTVAERERYARLLDWGLVDVWRAREPEKPGFTWWDYRAGSFRKNRGLRIDFLLASEAVHDRVRFIQPDREWREKVDGMTASDHAPLWADLED
jgi:exodeoxyribonuclease-3